VADAGVVVIGAGVVGLASAAALARAGRSVLVLEEAPGIAQGISSRNSEVVHSGIYYPTGSLKARLCVRGRELLYARCESQRIPYRKLGKLVVATDDAEIPALERLRNLGEANGVAGLELIDGREVARVEPQVQARVALRSPETGIVDAHGLCLSFLAEAESWGATLLLRHRVVGLELRAGAWQVTVAESEGRAEAADRITCEAVVNAAGLGSERIAALAGIDVAACGYRIRLCKGDYFCLAPGSPIRLAHLVYPLPEEAGLGIHSTLDLGGRIRFGPDAEYVAEPRLLVDASKAAVFARAVRRYLPRIEQTWLQPDFAGLRPKLAGPGEGFRDFVVAEESAAGLPGLVSCIGIESPGLTAAAAIAERVVALLAG